MMRFPIDLAPDDNNTLLVTSPDFPELVTFGDDEADATVRAADAFVTVIAERIARREPVPTASDRGSSYVVLGLTDTLKIELYQAMNSDGVGKAELGRRLKCHLPQVDRLLDLHHASTTNQLENALRALGREISVQIEKAARAA